MHTCCTRAKLTELTRVDKVLVIVRKTPGSICPPPFTGSSKTEGALSLKVPCPRPCSNDLWTKISMTHNLIMLGLLTMLFQNYARMFLKNALLLVCLLLFAQNIVYKSTLYCLQDKYMYLRFNLTKRTAVYLPLIFFWNHSCRVEFDRPSLHHSVQKVFSKTWSHQWLVHRDW